ncbi:MAG: hypothetical protein WBB22_02125 [Anaerolineae bacterium]
MTIALPGESRPFLFLTGNRAWDFPDDLMAQVGQFIGRAHQPSNISLTVLVGGSRR